MRHLKLFEIFAGNVIDISHQDVKQVAKYLEKLIGLKEDKNGYEEWLTDNWCFNQNIDEDFYCSYYFYFKYYPNKDCVALSKMKKYLFEHEIDFREEEELKKTRKRLSIDYDLEKFLYLLMKVRYPEYSDDQIENEVQFIVNVKKYNL